MRPSIDYRRYDPQQFSNDHPNDPVVAQAREAAQELADRLRATPLQSSPVEQRRDIEQRFDQLQDAQHEIRRRENASELQDLRYDYTNEKTDGIYKDAFDRLSRSPRPEREVASWEGTKREVDQARETANQDMAFTERREQREQFHAARDEAASAVIHEVQNELLRERGLDRESAETPHTGATAERAAELSAALESLQKPHVRSPGGRDHDLDH